MKYIDADRLTAFIKARRELHYKYFVKNGVGCIAEYKYDEDVELLDFIDSLQQEQPEVDFKIEERKWVHNAVDNIFPEDGDFMSEVDFRKILKDTACHFYELGFNARKV